MKQKLLYSAAVFVSVSANSTAPRPTLDVAHSKRRSQLPGPCSRIHLA